MHMLATGLANTNSTGSGGAAGTGDILIWTAVLVVFIGVALWIVVYARKRLLDDSKSDPSGFSLSEIVEMHRAGNLSEEEYRAARDMLTGSKGKSSQDSAKQPPSSSPGREGPAADESPDSSNEDP